ncbi:MAG: hypothetical protein AB8B64_09175 [Granulosicoccus sp.]
MRSAIHQISGSFFLLCILSSCSSSGGGGDDPLLITEEQPESVTRNDGPEGNSALIISDMPYPLDSAVGNIWGGRGDRFRIDLTLTDGNFALEPVELDGQSHQVLVPSMATAIVHVDIYSAGSSFSYGSYGFVPVDNTEDVTAGFGYFTDAFVGVDTNGDNRVSDGERYDVVDGVLEFQGGPPDISLSFSMTLSGGQSASGEYTGLFDFTER